MIFSGGTQTGIIDTLGSFLQKTLILKNKFQKLFIAGLAFSNYNEMTGLPYRKIRLMKGARSYLLDTVNVKC